MTNTKKDKINEEKVNCEFLVELKYGCIEDESQVSTGEHQELNQVFQIC
jgi:hypothetical protein